MALRLLFVIVILRILHLAVGVAVERMVFFGRCEDSISEGKAKSIFFFVVVLHTIHLAVRVAVD
jgi:hypothetical protein